MTNEPDPNYSVMLNSSPPTAEEILASNQRRMSAPPDSSYERWENLPSEAAIAAAWRDLEDRPEEQT